MTRLSITVPKILTTIWKHLQNCNMLVFVHNDSEQIVDICHKYIATDGK